MKSYMKLFVVFLFAWISSVGATERISANGKVQWMENGWFGEGMAFRLSAPATSACTSNANEYAISKDHPAYKEMVSVLLAAQSMQSDISLIVESDCIMSSTRVIAVRIIK